MSHFSVLLIHENDESSIMNKRSYDATEDEGADIEFDVQMTLKEAELEYKNYLKANSTSKVIYASIEDFMEGEYSHLNKEGDNYGFNNNYLGMYDWYVVGGRWSNILPKYKSKKDFKALLAKHLDLNNIEVEKKYRDNVAEYVKISSMPVDEACAYLNIGGQNELLISEDFTAENIIERWKNIEKKWSNNDTNIDDAMRKIISTIIIEEDGDETCYNEGDDNINDSFFIEQYNHFLKLNKEQGRAYQITILDCHT
jgi:hypothetical protein